MSTATLTKASPGLGRKAVRSGGWMMCPSGARGLQILCITWDNQQSRNEGEKPCMKILAEVLRNREWGLVFFPFCSMSFKTSPNTSDAFGYPFSFGFLTSSGFLDRARACWCILLQPTTAAEKRCWCSVKSTAWQRGENFSVQPE